MGQEITQEKFSEAEYAAFYHKLQQKTALLERLAAQHAFSMHSPMAGFEIEAWLVDQAMQPAPLNCHYLKTFNEP